jgi:hypothetical protein
MRPSFTQEMLSLSINHDNLDKDPLHVTRVESYCQQGASVCLFDRWSLLVPQPSCASPAYDTVHAKTMFRLRMAFM